MISRKGAAGNLDVSVYVMAFGETEGMAETRGDPGFILPAGDGTREARDDREKKEGRKKADR